jgi:Pyruvate/2-oxoacid:ferredoxin oxidoreductase delta subunit
MSAAREGGCMGHLHYSHGAHGDLAARLQRGPVGMPEPHDSRQRGAWQEIIEILFSPDDAALAARLPVVPAGLEALAARLGLAPEELRPRLEAMADRGLVLDLVDPRNGDTTYMLAPPVVGFFEFSMMRLDDGLPKARLAQAYEAYQHQDTAFLEEVSGAQTVVGRTLVHESAPADDLLSEVLDWERASACIEVARSVAVTNCFCRHTAEQLGRRCEFPMEACLSLDMGADYLVRHGFARSISREEGLDILTMARESGMVHIADNVRQEITYLCSCCACCCGELRSVRMGLPMVQPSGFQAATDATRCTGCGRCVRACPVQAVSLVSRGPRSNDGDDTSKRLLSHIDLDSCLGCGVCTGVCRDRAMSMERREQQPYVPLNAVEALTRRMLERGRLADLLVDGTAGRGPAFANAVLTAVLSLPPAETLLATEQVKSRFVRFALSRQG